MTHGLEGDVAAGALAFVAINALIAWGGLWVLSLMFNVFSVATFLTIIEAARPE